MAHITKVPTTGAGKPYEVRWSWYAEDAEGRTRRYFKQERFRSHPQAKAFKREVEERVAGGGHPDASAGKQRFAEWAERWYRYKQPNVKPSTARGYRSILDRSLLPALGHRQVRSLTTADVQDFILDLQECGLTPKTIRHHYQTLRSVLQHAARQRAISINPALDAELPTNRSTGRPDHEPCFLTSAEVERLAGAMTEYPYGLMVRFMASTGLRAGEVSGLNVGDLDLMRRRVTVRRTRTKVKASETNPDGWETHVPKSGKTRHVPVPPPLVDDLTGYLARHPHHTEKDAPLWPGRENGGAERFRGGAGAVTYDKPWERDAFYKRQFKPALRAAGLPARVRLHDLRHTYASISASLGIPAYRVAEYMGHASEVVTRTIYTHLFAEDSTADMDLWSQLIESSRATVTTPLRSETG